MGEGFVAAVLSGCMFMASIRKISYFHLNLKILIIELFMVTLFKKNALSI